MEIKHFKYALLASAITLGGCATTLEHRTPVDIASNSVQIHYPDAGVSEILAPPVKIFRELRSKVAGMAQLRTAGPFTDKEGTVYEGGAYLDILINYTSATPDPMETRQYSQARWPDGEIAQLADFGASVLDCRADIRNVRRFPFGNGYYGTGYYGYGPYGYGYDPYGYGYRHGSHNRRHHDRHADHNDENDHTDHNYNHTDHTTHDRNRRHRNGNTSTPARPAHTPPPQPDGPGTEPAIGPYSYSGSAPGSNSTRPDRTGQSRTASSAPPVSAHRRSHIQARQHRASQPKRNITNSRPHSSPGSNSGQSSSQQHQSRKRHRTGRHLNYYPTDPFYNPGYVDTVVRRYCARQENLRVFIPRRRLDAARTSGIRLLIRPRGGREEVLNLPPNYITGFMLAAWTPEGRRMTIPGYPQPRPTPKQKPASTTHQETSTPLPNPQAPNPKKPIVYGEN